MMGVHINQHQTSKEWAAQNVVSVCSVQSVVRLSWGPLRLSVQYVVQKYFFWIVKEKEKKSFLQTEGQ